MGEERAHNQAKKAGLGISSDGHIVSCSGNPKLVLLRLIRYFTDEGSLMALGACAPLIEQMMGDLTEEERNDLIELSEKESASEEQPATHSSAEV